MDKSLRDEYLDAMGIQQWVCRERPARTDAVPKAVTIASAVRSGSADDVAVSGLDWPELEDRVARCTRCALHETRTRTVFGTGKRTADWLIIGEAPGADEDRQGEPFVGRAGQLLTAMLQAIGYARDAVYITNILKCRPPGNRDPLPEEVACCHDYLERQIGLIGPGLILVVGRIAAHHLLQIDLPISRLRGQVHRYGKAEIPLVVTYHPAYLLRSPLEKRKSWDDLRLAQQVYREVMTAASSGQLPDK
jgi:uracil-DNA glycosylase family 4